MPDGGTPTVTRVSFPDTTITDREFRRLTRRWDWRRQPVDRRPDRIRKSPRKEVQGGEQKRLDM